MRRQLWRVVGIAGVVLLTSVAAFTGVKPVAAPGVVRSRIPALAGDHRSLAEFRSPVAGAPAANPAAEAYANRALPRGFISAEDVQRAAASYRKHAKGKPDTWQFIGPSTAFAPGPTTESLRDSLT